MFPLVPKERASEPSHGLVTGRPSGLLTHCLRLLPGDDLVASLMGFAQERQLSACVVLACVGSTRKTTLRPAASKAPWAFEGPAEIISFSGTFSDTGHHLHISVSDSSCSVYGGHALEGCIIRTTAELCIGIVQDVRFSRPHDERTGFNELSIETLQQPNPHKRPHDAECPNALVDDEAAKKIRGQSGPGQLRRGKAANMEIEAGGVDVDTYVCQECAAVIQKHASRSKRGAAAPRFDQHSHESGKRKATAVLRACRCLPSTRKEKRYCSCPTVGGTSTPWPNGRAPAPGEHVSGGSDDGNEEPIYADLMANQFHGGHLQPYSTTAPVLINRLEEIEAAVRRGGHLA